MSLNGKRRFLERAYGREVCLGGLAGKRIICVGGGVIEGISLCDEAILGVVGIGSEAMDVFSLFLFSFESFLFVVGVVSG